jgi:pyruvate dehydrogenase complex dihydrolipoamide acetyltransferase long form
MTDGTIVKWMKKEGEAISAGDVLCEIQTDKAVMSLESDDDGILAKILMPENAAEVKVGTPIAILVGEGEDWKNVEVPKSVQEAVGKPAETKTQQQQPVKSSSGGGVHGSSTGLIGPAVKSLLMHYGLNPSEIEASGPKGMILKGDVLRLVSEKKLQPLKHVAEAPQSEKPAGKTPSRPVKKIPSATPTDIEISSMRKTIAKRLLQSKSTIPHAYSVANCSIDRVMKLRKELQSIGVKVSVNDFIIKVVANALSKSPAINVAWEGSSVVQKGSVDISVAVATDNGLITPIVTNVAERDVIQISEQVKYLAEKARNGKLQPHEFMGGSFSISNLGMFGIHHFSAIINPPQCAILAVGGGHTAIGKDGKPVTTVGFTLSYDGSAITEEAAAKFLANLKHEVENASEISLGIYNLQSRLEMLELAAPN